MIHPFFFMLQLADFFKINQLKNVVNSVKNKLGDLFLLFLVFIIFEYYFSIWAYIQFGDDYNFCDEEPYDCPKQRCVSLKGCLFTTFDYSFKETGSVGAWLNDPDSTGGEFIDYSRWSFDNF